MCTWFHCKSFVRIQKANCKQNFPPFSSYRFLPFRISISYPAMSSILVNISANESTIISYCIEDFIHPSPSAFLHQCSLALISKLCKGSSLHLLECVWSTEYPTEPNTQRCFCYVQWGSTTCTWQVLNTCMSSQAAYVFKEATMQRFITAVRYKHAVTPYKSFYLNYKLTFPFESQTHPPSIASAFVHMKYASCVQR